MHCLTANGKGMELGVRYPGKAAFPSSFHPLILSFLDPATFLSAEAMFSVLRLAAKTWEDWMKWETESSGVQGSGGGTV